jgi:hypothetical protein
MKNLRKFILLSLILSLVCFFWSFTFPPRSNLIVIGWNSLGMHCANKDFQNMAILPPYNDVLAQVIEVGTPSTKPKIITTGYRISYEVPGNTTSITKTNFWTYCQQLFGVTLSNNIGLKGNGLNGNMVISTDHFIVEGIPLAPYADTDLIHEHAYQLGLLKLYDGSNNQLNSTQPVIPVSNEIGCVRSGCHSSETQILSIHETEGGFNPANKPILCASCHSSNALGTAGHAGVPSLSLAIHGAHVGETNDCYTCHPGKNTKCLRDIMFSKGQTCTDCHGNLANVAASIESGRQPWLQEPTCASTNCHNSSHAEESGKLYRLSKGHGGLYCAACHGAPHAIVPTVTANDNVQNIELQGQSGKLKKCSVCHGYTPTSAGPHGYLPTSITELSGNDPNKNNLLNNYPNPAYDRTTIPFEIVKYTKATLYIISLKGEIVLTLMNEHLNSGKYEVNLEARNLYSGTYYICLQTENEKFYKKIIIIR